MYQVGVIGDRDSVIGFRALGMKVIEAGDAGAAAQHLRYLVDHDFAVIFITEVLAEANSDLLRELRSRKLPAIIPIPSMTGSTGLGMRQVRESVRKAVGFDILENEDK